MADATDSPPASPGSETMNQSTDESVHSERDDNTATSVQEPTTVSVSPKMPDSRETFGTYIPLNPADMIKTLSPAFPIFFKADDTEQQFSTLCYWVRCRIAANVYNHFQSFEDDYAQLDPNAMTVPGLDTTREDPDVVFRRFKTTLKTVLTNSDFMKLTKEETMQAIAEKSKVGLEIDPPEPHAYCISMYHRGRKPVMRQYRSWRTLYRWREYPSSEYNRVVVVFNKNQHDDREGPQEPKKWYVQIFRNFNADDVDMLLPGSRVKLGMWDLVLLLGATLVGLVLAVADFIQHEADLLKDKTPTSIGTLVLKLLAPFFALLRGYWQYKKKANNYEARKCTYLMFHLVGNNSGAVAELLQDACDQESTEVILALFFAWLRASQSEPITTQQLETDIETWLRENKGVQVRFEAKGAISKLMAWGFASTETDADNVVTVKVFSLPEILDAVANVSAVKDNDAMDWVSFYAGSHGGIFESAKNQKSKAMEATLTKRKPT